MVGSPVSEGQFQTGAELMLWRPGLNHAKVRRCALAAALSSSASVHVALGAVVIVVGIGAVPALIGWLCLFGGSLALGLNVLKISVDYRCMDFDHQHDSCFLDKVRGEFFYRAGDFADLGPPIAHTVERIMDSVREVHASPAAAWVDPQQVHDVHQVAWNAVHILDQTRTLRGVVNDPSSGATAGDLTSARSQLAVVDDAVEAINNYLRQAVLLTQAWERKLTEIDLGDRLRSELDSVPHHTIDATLRRAESLPEAIFIYITAARDLTDAGPFEWEQVPHPSLPQVQR
jgi:hypothetical protein